MTIGAPEDTGRELLNEEDGSAWSGQDDKMNQTIYTDTANLANQVNAQSRGNGKANVDPNGLDLENAGLANLGHDRSGQNGASYNFSSSVSASQDSLSVDLAKMIESQIIPRLMLAHLNNGDKMQLEPSNQEAWGPQFEKRNDDRADQRPAREQFGNIDSITAQPMQGVPRFSVSQVMELAGILLEGDYQQAYDLVEAHRMVGAPLERIYLDLLAPAARHLGDLWDTDRAYISDVAVGLSRLHQLVRAYGDEFVSYIGPSKNGKNALIMPMPGETHTFGLVLVVEFFRKAGWDVSGSPLDAEDDPLVMSAEKSYDIVGFSVSAERNLAVLPEMIREVRRVSKNRNVKILVGGQIFIQKPHLVETVGADGWAKDGAQSVELANALAESASSKYL